MNIKGLRAFVRIMITGTLKAAAKDLNTSESALSRQLLLFEESIGLKLFSREKRRLIPTAEGKNFFSDAERLLQSIDQLPNITNQIKLGTRKHVRIVALQRIAEAIVVPAVSRFLAEYPDAELSIEIQPKQLMERWIASQEFDLGISALPASDTSIITEHVCNVPAVVVLHPDHPLASRSAISIADLKNERLILMTPETMMGQKVTDLFRNAGVAIHSKVLVSQIGMTCFLAASGSGVAIADAVIAKTFGHAIKMVPLMPRVEMSFGLLFSKSAVPTPTVNQLVTIIKDEMHAQFDEFELP